MVSKVLGSPSSSSAALFFSWRCERRRYDPFLGCHWTHLFGQLIWRTDWDPLLASEQEQIGLSPSSSLSFQPSVPGRLTKQRLRFHPLQGQSCRMDWSAIKVPQKPLLPSLSCPYSSPPSFPSSPSCPCYGSPSVPTPWLQAGKPKNKRFALRGV